MPWNPAAKHMAKIDEMGQKAQDRLRGAQNSDKTSMSDRLKLARSGAGQTAVGARWEKDLAARKAAAGAQSEEGEEERAVPAAPVRRQAPAAAAFPSRPPPPPQRNSGGAAVAAAAATPPPPPARNGSYGRPPLPARGVSASSSGSGAAPPAPPPRLPPRMNNDAGTPNPPPPYVPEDQASSVPAASPPPPPARRGPPPVPSAAGKRPPPAIPGKKPSAPAIPTRSNAATAASSPPPTAALASMSVSSPPPPPPPAPAAPAATQPLSSSLGPLTASRRPSTLPCSALSAATFFCYPTSYPEWTSHPPNSNLPWYHRPTATSPVSMPPHLQAAKDRMWNASVMRRTAARRVGEVAVETEEQVGAVLFGDLSSLWYRIIYTVGTAAGGDGAFECKVAYAEPPSPWLDSGLLQSSAASYGEVVARNVEAWEGTVVGDGECWTLANEAIKVANDTSGWPEEAKLLQTIERTHGHLIYYAEAGKGGLWRGGDVGNIRRGDVLEWDDYASCKQLAPNRGAKVSFGNREKGWPEHTAVVIGSASTTNQRSMDPSGSTPLPPSEFQWIEVIDQSAGKVASRSTVDLSSFTKGKLYIYRPVGKDAYLEGKVEAKWEGEGRRRGWEALN